MVKSKKILVISSILFMLFEISLGFYREMGHVERFRELSFFIIVFACLFCFLYAENSKNYYFTQAALILTVCADFYLVLIEPRKQLPAMFFFSGTQIFYFLRIYFSDNNKKRRKVHLITRIVLSVCSMVVPFFVLGDKTDMLSIVSVFYYANLITNIVFSFLNFKKLPILAIGLVMFLCCDTLIGLDVLVHSYFQVRTRTLLDMILYPGFDLAWAFYIPSQALLSMSLLPDRLRRT